MQRRTFTLAIPSALLPASGIARSRCLPEQALRYIVPVAAGGGSDMIGRVVTERWGKLLGQTIIVDNLGGGGGVIACQTTIALAARRLHADAGLRRHARHDAGDAQGPLRRDQGLHAHRHDRRHAQRAGRQQRACRRKTLTEFIDYVSKNPAKVSATAPRAPAR